MGPKIEPAETALRNALLEILELEIQISTSISLLNIGAETALKKALLEMEQEGISLQQEPEFPDRRLAIPWWYVRARLVRRRQRQQIKLIIDAVSKQMGKAKEDLVSLYEDIPIAYWKDKEAAQKKAAQKAIRLFLVDRHHLRMLIMSLSDPSTLKAIEKAGAKWRAEEEEAEAKQEAKWRAESEERERFLRGDLPGARTFKGDY